MMISIRIEPRLGTPQSHVDAPRKRRSLLSLLIGGAVICSALGLAGARDAAAAQQLQCGKGNIIDRTGLGRACPPLSGAEVREQLRQQRAADKIVKDLRQAHAAIQATRARQAGRDLARGIGQRLVAKTSDMASGVVAGLRIAHRTAGDSRHIVARHAGVGSVQRAYRHVREERREFNHAAVRFARAPGYRTFAGLRHEFGEFRSARAQFHRAAAHSGHHR
jgi:hypothetical protein